MRAAMQSRRRLAAGAVVAALACAGVGVAVEAAPIVFSAGGSSDPASIQATVDAFRAALGDPNNGNSPGPLAGGRREINWDGGGGVSATTPPVTPFNTFLNTRGAQLTTPGTGLSQATPAGLATLVGNATYATTFGTFSPLRLFTPIDSNVTDLVFFIPGTGGAQRAAVRGFGAVFTDVDLAASTELELFDPNGTLIFSSAVSPGTVPDASLSFLGIVFDAGEVISRVRITTGNAALGPNDGSGVDIVAMDDFLFAEPVAVPEPASGGALLLLGSAVAMLLRAPRSRRRT